MSSPSTPITPSMPLSAGLQASKKSRGKAPLSTSTILLLIFTNGASFMAGNFYASNAAIATQFPKQRQLPNEPLKCPPSPPPPSCPPQTTCSCPPQTSCPPQPSCPPIPTTPSCPPCPVHEEEQEISVTANKKKRGKNAEPQSFAFPELVNRFAVGMSHIPKDNFTNTFDLGVPIDHPLKEGDKGVLMLYSSQNAMPRRYGGGGDSNNGKNNKNNDNMAAVPMELLSAQEATENCDYMNIIMTYHEGRRRQCLAIVPQYESFHIQKWLRVPDKGPATGHHPLRMVPRGYARDGTSAFHPPIHDKHTKKAWKMLEGYLDSVEDVMADLKPIVKKISLNNAIVVMVCNFGQSQLLLNFACAAKAKGIDVSNVLVFATDEETRQLAESVGLHAYFDKRNFGAMPKKAAKVYGDGIFTNMMLSKVICVHLASLMGVDFLFQDVDVLWYKNPLPYFQNKTSPISHFDAYFQDDGSRSLRFSPFCANSGFYFIRNNPRTRYFLTSFLMQSDLVLRSFSHQSAMISIMAEHSSLLGLRVKVLTHEEFPSGFVYHRKKGKGRYGNFFTELFAGKQDPWVLHMSWTESKTNKILYYKQLDQWYLQDKCMDKEMKDIDLGSGDSTFVDSCCSAESLFSCHFRDKPSSRPCKDSPALDKNGESFW